MMLHYLFTGLLWTFYLIVAAAVMCGPGWLAYRYYEDQPEDWSQSYNAVKTRLATALVVLTVIWGCAVFIGGLVWLMDRKEPDPCRYTVMAGKVAVTRYYEGQIIYGGRLVQCGYR